MTDELVEKGGKIMIKLVVLRAKTYSHVIDDSSEENKARKYVNSVSLSVLLVLKQINSRIKQTILKNKIDIKLTFVTKENMKIL